jgi:hypothetical protein
MKSPDKDCSSWVPVAGSGTGTAFFTGQLNTSLTRLPHAGSTRSRERGRKHQQARSQAKCCLWVFYGDGNKETTRAFLPLCSRGWVSDELPRRPVRMWFRNINLIAFKGTWHGSV